jgi:hypothetical protein
MLIGRLGTDERACSDRRSIAKDHPAMLFVATGGGLEGRWTNGERSGWGPVTFRETKMPLV